MIWLNCKILSTHTLFLQLYIYYNTDLIHQNDTDNFDHREDDSSTPPCGQINIELSQPRFAKTSESDCQGRDSTVQPVLRQLSSDGAPSIPSTPSDEIPHKPSSVISDADSKVSFFAAFTLLFLINHLFKNIIDVF